MNSPLLGVPPEIVPLLSLAAAVFLANIGAASGQSVKVPAGKEMTDRSIVLKTVVAAPIEEVYKRWTTVKGVKSFFAEDAEIEARKGGNYFIYFLPREHPESRANSSYGCRLLDLEENRRLAFEWSIPPFAAHLNRDPQPLWVEVTLSSLAGAPGHTEVKLANYGYGRGPDWDRVYEFFVRNWGEILYRLDRAVVDPTFVNSWAR